MKGLSFNSTLHEMVSFFSPFFHPLLLSLLTSLCLSPLTSIPAGVRQAVRISGWYKHRWATFKDQQKENWKLQKLAPTHLGCSATGNRYVLCALNQIYSIHSTLASKFRSEIALHLRESFFYGSKSIFRNYIKQAKKKESIFKLNHLDRKALTIQHA